jgi:hypothetical protein
MDAAGGSIGGRTSPRCRITSRDHHDGRTWLDARALDDVLVIAVVILRPDRALENPQ